MLPISLHRIPLLPHSLTHYFILCCNIETESLHDRLFSDSESDVYRWTQDPARVARELEVYYNNGLIYDLTTIIIEHEVNMYFLVL